MNVYEQRVAAADWNTISSELETVGCALTGELLTADETAELRAIYPDDARFRSTIDMAR